MRHFQRRLSTAPPLRIRSPWNTPARFMKSLCQGWPRMLMNGVGFLQTPLRAMPLGFRDVRSTESSVPEGHATIAQRFQRVFNVGIDGLGTMPVTKGAVCKLNAALVQISTS